MDRSFFSTLKPYTYTILMRKIVRNLESIGVHDRISY